MPPKAPRTAQALALGSACGRAQCEAAGLQLDYLYASPLDVAPLDIRSEIEALATMPGVECLSAACLGKQSSRKGCSLCMYVCRYTQRFALPPPKLWQKFWRTRHEVSQPDTLNVMLRFVGR